MTSIGDYTFCECSSLEENLIPSSDKEIGIVIFGECLSLSHITISPFVKSIEKRTFIYDAYHLKKLRFLHQSNLLEE